MRASVGRRGESADEPKPLAVDPPEWTTVPADDGSSGWELYQPPPAAPTAQPVQSRPPAPTVTPTQAAVAHRVTHRTTVPDHPRRQPAHRETVVKTEPASAVLAATATATRPAYDSILLLTALCVAIACFAVGATPTDLIRWRRGAIFVVYRRTSVTVAGSLLLLLAAAILLATH